MSIPLLNELRLRHSHVIFTPPVDFKDALVINVFSSAHEGNKACRKLKRSHPLARVLVICRDNPEGEIMDALTSGANGLVVQNANAPAPGQLQSALTTVYNGNMWLDSAIAPHVVQLLSELKTLRMNLSAANPGVELLSQREREVLKLVVNGLSNQQIARNLDVSLETIKSHVKNILDKLDVNDRTQAAIKAVREGLI